MHYKNKNMKKIITAALVLTTTLAVAQSTPKPQAPKGGLVKGPGKTKATQTQGGGRTITFRDGKTYKITGEEIGGYTQQSDGKPSKRVTTYYLRNGNDITITVVKDWIEQKTMDELRVYKLKVQDLDPDRFGDISENEADENQIDKTYGLSLNANDGAAIKFDNYSLWEMKPEQRTSSYFTIEIKEKEMLEKIKTDISSLFPKKAAEE